MGSNTETMDAPLSDKEAEAKAKVMAMVEEMQRMNEEMRKTQEETEIIGQRTDATLARLREKLGF